jgi:hypothetical protein
MEKHFLTFLSVLIYVSISAQTFTMGKKCKEQNNNGKNLLKDKTYKEALDAFEKWKNYVPLKMLKKLPLLARQKH